MNDFILGAGVATLISGGGYKDYWAILGIIFLIAGVIV